MSQGIQQSDAIQKSAFDLTQEQIQSLIATSTGFIDTYMIPVYDAAAILLPQNLVLSAMNVPARSETVEWHEKLLPTYIVHHPDLVEVTALVIDGDREETCFAILCDSMPKTLRLRISEVLDVDKPIPATVYQYVEVNGQQYQVPNLSYIQQQLFSN
ncbi:hypothetical protein GWI33_002944 [Rhynchophorus ferrugineus]|uniref:Uncharacterized protein n=1 Tax=Rhynchophorus ferrugineus TaxID=354439 RepID=A0A834IAV3_RHYFE|nr:hypothetical protein GWI33_002944 [Rhynchophorus ferrugineus]